MVSKQGMFIRTIGKKVLGIERYQFLKKLVQERLDLRLLVILAGLYAACALLLLVSDIGLIRPRTVFLAGLSFLVLCLLIYLSRYLMLLKFRKYLGPRDFITIFMKALSNRLKGASRRTAALAFAPLALVLLSLPRSFLFLLLPACLALLIGRRKFRRLFEKIRRRIDLPGRYMELVNRLSKSGLSSKGDPRRALVLRSGGLGDILMAFPMARGLKESGKATQVIFSTDPTFHQITNMNAEIDGWVSFHSPLHIIKEMNRAGLVINLSGIIESERELPGQDAFCRHAGVRPSSMAVRLEPPRHYKKQAEKILHDAGVSLSDRLIGIQVRSAVPTRSWIFSRVEEYAHLMASKGFKVLLFGDRPEWGFTGFNIMNLVGKTSLGETAALIRACDLMVCPDSGLLHLAAALGVSVVGLFGVIDPKLRTTHYLQCLPLWGRPACSPCNDHSYPAKCEMVPTYACMHEISVTEVFEASMRLLRERELAEGPLCKACGRKARSMGEKRGFMLYVCDACDFVFIETGASIEESAEIYNTEDYWNLVDTAWEDRNSRDRADIILDAVRKFSGKPVENILDMGCGKGMLVDHIRAKGYNAVGVDIIDQPPDKPYLLKGDLDSLGFTDGYFSAAVSIEVFEHISDPVGYLQLINRYMTMGGVLFIQTNHADAPGVRECGVDWWYYDPPQHCSFYTTKAFKSLMDKAGFELVFTDDFYVVIGRKIREAAAETPPLKLELGSGPFPYPEPGFAHSDTTVANPHQEYVIEINSIPFPTESISELYASHVLEHAPWNETLAILREWYRVLKKGGKLTVFVPNFNYISKEYLKENFDKSGKVYPTRLSGYPTDMNMYWVNMVLFSKGGYRDMHRAAFDFDYLCALLRAAGFSETRPAARRQAHTIHGDMDMGVEALK